MKVLVEYEVGPRSRPIKISAERTYDETNYTRIICQITKQMRDAGHELLNIRCLDPHPKDLVNG